MTSKTILCSKYIACMEEIKKRTEVVTAFINGEITSKYLITTVESVFLQFRKILELIALSSLVANHEKYSKCHANFKKHWKAKQILNELEKINPKFYPYPTKQIPVSEGLYNTPKIKSGYLTKEDFIELYDRCSNMLHSNNPFSDQKQEDIKNILSKEAPEWLDKIIILLNHHHVHPIDDELMYILIMQSEADGRVHMCEFKRL